MRSSFRGVGKGGARGAVSSSTFLGEKAPDSLWVSVSANQGELRDAVIPPLVSTLGAETLQKVLLTCMQLVNSPTTHCYYYLC